MKWYRCLIAGENFPGELIGEDKLIGFYTTRFVQAKSSREAELEVLSQLKVEKKLQLPDGITRSEIAKVYFEEIEEICGDEVPEIQSGISFYPMDEY